MRSSGFLWLLTATSAAAAYARYLRPWQHTWGAAPDEAAVVLPGEQLVARPSFNAARAVSIAASPEPVWPWLVGLTRGGWYRYHILDNLGRYSARLIIPELQPLAAGDIIPMSPSCKQRMAVHSFDAPHSMIWGTPRGHHLGLAARPHGRRINAAHHQGPLPLPLVVSVHGLLRAARVR